MRLLPPCVRLVVAYQIYPFRVETTMKPKYSEAFIGQARVKLLSRGERTIQSVAQELNVNYYTAKNWLKPSVTAKVVGSVAKEKRPQDWSAKEQLIALYKTYGMSGESLNAWCRENGLFAHHLTSWEGAFCTQSQSPSQTVELRAFKDEIAQLKRDLTRKEKALSEAAALLILQKKFRALWEDEAK